MANTGEEFGTASIRFTADFTGLDQEVAAKAVAAAQKAQAAVAQATAAAQSKIGASLTKTGQAGNAAAGGLNNAANAAGNLGRNTNQANNALRNQAAELRTLTASLGFITGAFVVFGKKAVETASGIVEAINAVQVAFGGASGGIVAFARTADDSLGLTDRGILDATANFGLLFREIGLGEDIIAGFSEQLVKAGADIGSVFNVNATKVLQDFTSGIQGQTRVVRKYGIDISIATLQQKAFELGIVSSSRELSENEKRLARTAIILESSTIAIGDAQATSETFAGSIREFRSASADASETVGLILIPSVQKVIDLFASGIRIFQGAPPAIQAIVVSLGVLAAAALSAAAAMAVLGTVAGRFGVSILGLIPALARGIAGLNPIVLGVAAAVGALFIAFNVSKATSETEKIKKGIQLLGKETEITKEKIKDLFDLDVSQVSLENVEKLTNEFAQLKAEIDASKPTFVEYNRDTFELSTKAGEAAAAQRDFAKAQKIIIQSIKDGFPAQGQAIINTVEETKARDALQKVFNRELQTNRQRLADQQAFTEQNKELLKSSIEIQRASDEERSRLFDQGVQAAERILDASASRTAADKAVAEATDAVTNAQQRLNKVNREGRVDTEKVTNAQIALEESHQRVTDATLEISEAEDKLNQLRARGKVDIQEVITAEDSLTDAIRRREDAEKNLLNTEEELRLARLPASERELSEAIDEVTKAEIALDKIRRERSARETKEIKKLDLRGKSLDEIRNILANQRATDQALNRTQTDENKLKEDAILSEISERDAINNLADAQKALTDLKSKGSDEDKIVIDLTQQITRLRQDQTRVIRDEASARNEVTRAKEGDPDFEKDVAQAERDVNEAKRAKVSAIREEKSATEELNVAKRGDPDFGTNQAEAVKAVADARDNLAAALLRQREALIKLQALKDNPGDEIAENNQALRDRIRLNQELINQFPQLETTLRSLDLRLNKNPGVDPLFTAKVLAALFSSGSASPFEDIFRKLGLNVPSVNAEGGVFTKPTLGWFGEAGREIIAPMTKPFRAASLLASDPAWPVVARQIAQINGGSLVKPPMSLQSLKLGPGSGGSNSSAADRTSRAMLMQLETISSKLDHLGGDKIDINLVGSSNKDLEARKLARKLEEIQNRKRYTSGR